MIIEARFFLTMRKYLPEGKDGYMYNIDVKMGSTVKQVLETLNIPEEEPKIILVNGGTANSETVLHSGDVLSLLAPVGGG